MDINCICLSCKLLCCKLLLYKQVELNILPLVWTGSFSLYEVLPSFLLLSVLWLNLVQLWGSGAKVSSSRWNISLAILQLACTQGNATQPAVQESKQHIIISELYWLTVPSYNAVPLPQHFPLAVLKFSSTGQGALLQEPIIILSRGLETITGLGKKKHTHNKHWIDEEGDR